ncbi:MAG: amidohydrolase family protein [Planctomycetaceae bacterium]
MSFVLTGIVMFDIILRSGTVIDGSRAPRVVSDVGIVGDRITAVGNLADAAATITIDAAGKIVAPGFVDVHNHSDGWMLKQPLQAAKILQGFTSEVLLLDGIGYAPVDENTWREWFFYLRALDGLRLDEYEGWRSLEEFMQCVEGRTTQNALMHVPYANVRSLICGFGSQPPSREQMASIRTEIRRGMEAGAVGLSTGLDYIVQCFSTTDELIEACRVVAEFGGLYATHIRYKLGMVPALDEALRIAVESGASLHISHLKARAGQPTDEVMAWLEKARQQVPLSFDVYPYLPGSTMLNYLLPYDVWEDGPLAAMGKLNHPDTRERFRDCLRTYKLDLDNIRIAWLPGRENSCHQGKLLSDYVEETGLPAEEALLNLLIEERMAVLCVYLEGDDRQIDPFLQHDLYMMGSDGIHADSGLIHPRQFGSAARLLGSCVRERGLFSLEDAIHKLSGHAAEKFGLKDRGRIREAAFADVVVFDPATIRDQATYDNPQTPAGGVSDVLVNGIPVVCDGHPVDLPDSAPRPGRFVKFHR